MSIRKWEIAPRDDSGAAKIAESTGLPLILAVLLRARGFSDPEQIRALFSSDWDFSDPFLMADMQRAADRILAAVDGFEKIAVYGDYDADGVTATAMLYSYLESCGANVMYYIPDREGEGYGLNCAAVDFLHGQGAGLIVTVDNGISSLEEVDYANSLSMDVVVTDHHRPRETLPSACAVVDPHRADCQSPFKDFSGVGVAFKLIMALEGRGCDLTALIDNYADLAAIGTIGDIVPLTGENRILVREGLKLISRTDRIGLKALLEQAGMEGRRLTAENAAFTLVPRINATGRIGSPDRAVRLLLSEFPEEAGRLSADICDDNDYRRQIEAEIFEQVLKQIRADPLLRFDRVLVVSGENWHPGVIGIVASRVTERFGKPSIVISRLEKEARGSGRSVEGFSLFEAVRSCAPLLTKFGGHPMAAGLSMPEKNIPAFRREINRYAASLGGAMPVPVLSIDCLLRPEELTLDLPRAMELLEPFGTGNPAPLFGLFGVTLAGITPVGGGKHLRLSVETGNCTVHCMKFGTELEQFPYRTGDQLDLAVSVSARKYNGRDLLSVVVRDIRTSGMDQRALLAGKELYERVRRGERLAPEQSESMIPDRDDFAALYRFLRAGDGFCGGAEALLGRLNRPGMGLQKLLTALDVLEEHGLLSQERADGTCAVRLLPAKGKTNLFDSHLLHMLRNTAEGGG